MVLIIDIMHVNKQKNVLDVYWCIPAHMYWECLELVTSSSIITKF